MCANNVLTLDIGTSSVRAQLYDTAAHAVPQTLAQLPYSIHTTADGTAETDPATLMDLVAQCIDRTLHAAGRLPIAAVSTATMATTCVAIDAAGAPVTPLYTYADTRAAANATHLRSELDERASWGRTGTPLRASYWPARLRWLREQNIAHTAARYVPFGGYMLQQLFGTTQISASEAAWTGLLNRHTRTWDTELLAALGITSNYLSPIVDACTPVSGLSSSYAARWPQLAHIPWFPAVGDGAAANVGSGCVGSQRIALTVGTTGALRLAVPATAQLPAGLWCYQVQGNTALLGGATSEGGNVVALARQLLQLGPPETVEAQLATMAPDAHGLTMLPFVAGERSPGWAGDVRATIHGIGMDTTPLDILRAGLEAVAYRFALIGERLFPAYAADQTVIASGGALLNSPTWVQICADVLGRPVVVSAEPEATSRGAALIALHGLGVIPALDTLPANDGRRYTPNPQRHAIYRAAIARQQALYNALIGEQPTPSHPASQQRMH